MRKVAEYLPVNWITQLTHFFECRVRAGAPKCSHETQEVAFFSLDALPKLLPHFYREWIEDALARRPEVLRKKIRGVHFGMFLKLLILHPILVSRYLLTKIGVHLN